MINTLDLSPFPNNVGTILNSTSIDIEKHLITDIPKKTIIRIYGVVGSGKGTLAKQLCQNYPFTNLETSNILRSATWIYKTLNLEFSKENTDKVFDQIDIKIEGKKLIFFWNKQDKQIKLESVELRSNVVDQYVSTLSGDPYFREKYYNKINFILENLVDSPVILDGRGCDTPYLREAEKNNFKVIRIFLWVNEEISYDRFLSRLNITETIETKSSLKLKFTENVLNRDKKDYENVISNNLGTISADTGIIDTSHLSPEQILEITLGFIVEKLNL